jgi:hypothetical protein
MHCEGERKHIRRGVAIQKIARSDSEFGQQRVQAVGADSVAPLSFAEVVGMVHGLLGGSAVLGRLGYTACSRELSDETPTLPARCRFALQPSGSRRLVIDFCYLPSGNHFFTVEIFNLLAGDSFLLDEWLSRWEVPLDPYPFILSSYAGAERERLADFIAFLDRQLSSERLVGILAGRDWEHIPFDWGALK